VQPSCRGARADHDRRAGEIPRQQLGRTGSRVSAPGVGGYHPGDFKAVGGAVRLVHEVVDAGITFLTTAGKTGTTGPRAGSASTRSRWGRERANCSTGSGITRLEASGGLSFNATGTGFGGRRGMPQSFVYNAVLILKKHTKNSLDKLKFKDIITPSNDSRRAALSDLTTGMRESKCVAPA
jgi:hypothetical protein